MMKTSIAAFTILLIVGCPKVSQPSTENSPHVEKPVDNISSRQTADIKTLINTIDDDAPISHLDYTPSVVELIKRGPEVIPHVLPLMLSEVKVTRFHAKVVLSLVTMRMHGFVLGKGWVAEGDQERWRVWWKEVGDLDEEADKASRTRAIELWTKWWESHRKL